jgi:DNA replication protein DnaC
VTDDFSTPSLPRTLAGADPFGAPGRPGPVQQPVRRESNPDAQKYPCPCMCRCGNDTSLGADEVTSLAAAKHLRCAPCASKGHFGLQWNPDPNAMVSPHVEQDKVVVGKRGTTVAIRHHIESANEEQAQWEREAALELEQQRRDEARDRWMARMPERWRLPYEPIDEIDERLVRLKNNETVGTSLICFGPFGSGKTWAAHTYARAAVDQWLLWPSEITIGTEGDIIEPIANAGFRIGEVMDKILKPNLKMLIIDDVGQMSTYRSADDRWAAFGKVVDWMYAHRRTLVITTNLTLGKGNELEQWIGAAAYERLRSMAGAKQVFRDEDKRGEMTAKWEAEYNALHNNDDPALAQGRDQ